MSAAQAEPCRRCGGAREVIRLGGGGFLCEGCIDDNAGTTNYRRASKHSRLGDRGFLPPGSVTGQPHVSREQRDAAAIDEALPDPEPQTFCSVRRDAPQTIHRMRERLAEGWDLDAKPRQISVVVDDQWEA